MAKLGMAQIQFESTYLEHPELDMSLLEYNLSLTFEERLENHQRALALLAEILKARQELYGESQSSPQTTP